MSPVQSVRSVQAEENDGNAAAPAGGLGAFLGVLAMLLRETTARFEETTGRVSDMVIAHTGRAGPDLVLALQDFDRLQQEFSALGEVLSRMEQTTGEEWPGSPDMAELKHELLKTVTITELRKRLATHFETPETLMSADDGDELVAEF